jgi:hypothetical protein
LSVTKRHFDSIKKIQKQKDIPASRLSNASDKREALFHKSRILAYLIEQSNKYLHLAVHYNLPVASTKPGSTEVSIAGANASLTEPVCKPARHHQSESRTIFLPATWQRVATEHICQSSEEARTASFQNLRQSTNSFFKSKENGCTRSSVVISNVHQPA